jgi:hypothetical protein
VVLSQTIQSGLKRASTLESFGARKTISCPDGGPQDHAQLLKNFSGAAVETVRAQVLCHFQATS